MKTLRTVSCLLALLAMITFGQTASGSPATFINDQYVKVGATGSGSSWADAGGNIQAAINTAGSGDKIYVAQGTYYEAISLVSDVVIYGGFAGTETELSQRKPAVNQTIIHPQSAPVTVVTMKNISSARLDGFIIIGGDNSAYNDRIHLHPAILGGGILCENLDDSNTVANCTIKRCWANHGGGVYCSQASPLFFNCIISNNSANYRHDMSSFGNPGTGGGVYCENTSTPTFLNCTIYNNRTSNMDYSAIYNPSDGAIQVINCTVWENSLGGAGYYYTAYSCIQDWTGGGRENITSNPLFVDPENGDFHLLPDSPCIDAGKFIEGLTTDFEGEPRPMDGVNEVRGDGSDFDIGADEFTGSPVDIDILRENFSVATEEQEGTFLTFIQQYSIAIAIAFAPLLGLVVFGLLLRKRKSVK